MLKYLQVVFDRLSGQKAGISANSGVWTGQPDTPATVQSDMDSITDKNNEIDALEDELSQKRAEARTLAKDLTDKADKTEKRAIAIHADNPQKLQEYNISLPAEPQTQAIPDKAVIKKLRDDDDGEGFKITIMPLARADFFEVQRGRIPSDGAVPPPPVGQPAPTVLQPPYPFLRNTKKLMFVDDDVEPGVRYFYRVRGVNATGPGEWSEPVSGVQ